MDMRDYSDEAFFAYVAGLTDGEGNIDINRSFCHIRINVSNTVKEVLDAICSRLGYGVVRKMSAPNAPAHHKQRWALIVGNAHDVRAFLFAIRPFLQIKSAKADESLMIISRMQERMEELDSRNREILAAIKRGETQKVVAGRYKISQQTVSRIKKGHTWPSEQRRLNARQNLKKFYRPKDMIFRLHEAPSLSGEEPILRPE